MGSYRVELTPEAIRSIAALPDKVRAAVVETIAGTIAENPRRAGKPLTGELHGLHSARRGDFRVIYLIDDDRHVIVVLRAHHRRDAYRRR
jgi:mRNA-degrading endonuclease RelE of RelBE toxin-antitoxin system